MKIERVTIETCVMRKQDPAWRFALAANPVTEGLIVTLTADDGTAGYGYASATAHMGASLEGLSGTLRRLAPLVEGGDPMNMASIRRRLDQALLGNNQAKAGIDNALYDLAAKAMGIPINRLFGGVVRDSFPVLRILAIKAPDDMASRAETLMGEGYRYFKIKLHGDVAEDVARVAAIRARLGGDVHLTVDANQAYAPKDAIRALNRMAEYDIDLAEQPVAIDDLAGLKLVTDSVPVTVEADESAGSLGDVAYLAQNRIVDAVSLKVAKLGGLWNTLAAAQICAANNIRYRFGAHVGSRLLSATAMQLAAALPDIWYACEFGEFERLLDDPFEGIDVVDGAISLPDGPGAGVAPA